jgi:hypothetical protein
VAQNVMAQDQQPPLPVRNPLRTGASGLKKPPPPGELPTIPWTDAEVAAAKIKCAEALSSIKLSYEPLPPVKQGLCGAPAPILVKSLGSDPKVELDPPAMVTSREGFEHLARQNSSARGRGTVWLAGLEAA